SDYMKQASLIITLLLASSVGLQAQVQKTFTIDATQPIAKVSPHMWGVFFEDINLGADGGIYAELIKNRSFEFTEPLMGWKKLGQAIPEGVLLVLNRAAENPNNPRFLRVNTQHITQEVGLQNEGFRGMGIKENLRYDFSVRYRQVKPGIKLHIELVDSTGRRIGKGEWQPEGGDSDWQKGKMS